MENFHLNLGQNKQDDGRSALIHQVGWGAGDRVTTMSQSADAPDNYAGTATVGRQMEPPGRVQVDTSRRQPDNPTVVSGASQPPENSSSTNGRSGYVAGDRCTKDLTHVALALDMQFANTVMERTPSSFKIDYSTGFASNKIDATLTPKNGGDQKSSKMTWEEGKDNIVMRAEDAAGTMKMVATAAKSPDNEIIFNTVVTNANGEVHKGWDKATFDSDCGVHMVAQQWRLGQIPSVTTQTNIDIAKGKIDYYLLGSNGRGTYGANAVPMWSGSESGAVDVIKRPTN